MSSRQGNSRTSQPPLAQQQAPPSSASTRQNEYFVPRDGIDREVITADICRYLGNDALVRPGTYESPDGRITQGYFITAYRNLTSAMIQDLKADSARWDQERRAASQNRSAGGGAGATSREARQDYRTSNTFRDRESRENRDHYQGNPAGVPDYGGAMDIDQYNPAAAAPRPAYPGTGNSGYNGVNSATYANQQYAAQTGYTQSPYAGAQSYGAVPAADSRYGTTMDYSPSTYMATAANYGAAAYPQDARMPPVTAAPRTTGYSASATAGYASADPNYYPQAATNPYSQPLDTLYGRAPAGTTPSGYSTVADPSQYGDSQPPVPSARAAAASPSTAASSTTQHLASSGTATTTSRREDRERTDRHRDRTDRSDRDRDRDDRHGASTTDRHGHRHRTRQ